MAPRNAENCGYASPELSKLCYVDDETTLRPTAATNDREDGDLEATMDTVSTISQSHPDEGESSVDVSAEVDPSNLWPNGGKDIPYTFGRRFRKCFHRNGIWKS